MTAPALTTPIDPTGLGGERICRLSTEGAPTLVELWVYPTTRDFEAIADAWFMRGAKASAERYAGALRYVRITRESEDLPSGDVPADTTLRSDVVLVLAGPNGRKRTYPCRAGQSLCEVYVIGGEHWHVVEVWRDELDTNRGVGREEML